MRAAVGLLLLGVVRAQWPQIPQWQIDAWDAEIASENVTYRLSVAGGPEYIVSHNASNLPAGLSPELSNNCVGVAVWDGRLFMGFRTAPFHFASNETKIVIMSQASNGSAWELETEIALGTDAREPHFVIANNDTFVFSFFQAGVDPLAFEPNVMYHTYYEGPGQWSPISVWGQPHEVPWQLGATASGRIYATSYEGSHYSITNRPDVRVFFNYSDDAGLSWAPANESAGFVYHGGVSEVGWSFDLAGDLFAVLRNEDGDDSGWGSRIAYAPAGDLGSWRLYPANTSNEWIYESPRSFRFGNDVYLVARRDTVGPYWNHSLDTLPWELEHDLILAQYSLHSHTTAIWQLDAAGAKAAAMGEPLPPQSAARQAAQRAVPDGASNPDLFLSWLTDIPGCGDTAFPSIVRIGKYTYVIANYTSPTALCTNWPWIEGQISPDGTSIYMLVVQFTPT